MLNGKRILITGGTGSFGNCFVDYVLAHYRPERLIVYSRDEFKQFHMRSRLMEWDSVMRYVVGDVRDGTRLRRAMEGVDCVVHAAALKQVPTYEYNPGEAVKTNINGAMNVIEAALDTGVRRVVALSTDKAVHPVNVYEGGQSWCWTSCLSRPTPAPARSAPGLPSSATETWRGAGARLSRFSESWFGWVRRSFQLRILR